MPIALADRVVALLGHLSPADIEAMPPAERRRLADQCRHVANVAEPRDGTTPKAGVLAALRDGRQS